MSTFRNLTIYTFPCGWTPHEEDTRAAAGFVPCDTWSMESAGLSRCSTTA